ncbi:hypothetical protein QYF61_023113 [Mycteria americana]|uniref:Uncharacterized protein n=1 Tax=Mycteria americana TaxID=33587 RepID=A0AAN7PLT5_MYCAM|nr:hypothetical protein QYF61_023113 [Mycteria americana]
MGVPGRAFEHELAEVKKAKAHGAALAEVQAANQRKLFFPSIWHLRDCIWSTWGDKERMKPDSSWRCAATGLSFDRKRSPIACVFRSKEMAEFSGVSGEKAPAWAGDTTTLSAFDSLFPNVTNR